MGSIKKLSAKNREVYFYRCGPSLTSPGYLLSFLPMSNGSLVLLCEKILASSGCTGYLLSAQFFAHRISLEIKLIFYLHIHRYVFRFG
jgi:hypothetical protein